MGEGGGWDSPMGGVAPVRSIDEGEFGDRRDSGRPLRERPDLPLFPDVTEAASDLSTASVPLDSMAEFLGLSVFPEPGILDLSDRNDREESLVSDLLNDG